MKLRLLLLFLVAPPFACIVKAETCTTVNYAIKSDVKTLDAHGNVTNETKTWSVTCTYTGDGSTYDSFNVSGSATGGYFGPSGLYFCGPSITISKTVGTGSSINSVTVTSGNGTWVSSNCANPPNTVATSYCAQYSCPPPPPPCQPVGSPPYGGEGACWSWDTNSCSWVQVTCNSSPILIDASGNGFQLTSAAGGVSYDISGNGAPVQMAWTAAGAENAFLCLPDAYGGCNSGKQLFGNFTPQPTSSTPNGFAALAVYDTPANGGNGDGVIDAHDAIFSSLRLWIDANHDGVTQPNELFTLPQLGVTSISLNYKWDQRTDQYGNVFRYRAQVGSTSGTGRMAYDVFFATQTNTNTAKACPAPKASAKPSGR